MLKRITAAAAMIVLTMGQAAAAEGEGFLNDPKIRFGIGVGRVALEADDFDFNGHATGWSIFGGYEFNPYLAVEAGYMDGGESSDTIIGVEVNADVTSWQASVLGSLPLGDIFSLYARAGMFKWESAQSYRLGNLGAVEEFDGTDPYFGAGAAVEVEGALLRVEYDMADLDDSDVRVIQLSLVWRF